MLGLSDLQMAWRIGEGPGQAKFRKGKLYVVPMPNRSYRRDQTVSLYFEAYGLTKDAFGQTDYRVTYILRRAPRKGVRLFGSLSSAVGWLFAPEDEEVGIAYERQGTEDWERLNVEVDPEKVRSGLNEVEVTLEDHKAGKRVAKRAVFQLSDEK